MHYNTQKVDRRQQRSWALNAVVSVCFCHIIFSKLDPLSHINKRSEMKRNQFDFTIMQCVTPSMMNSKHPK